MDHIILLTEKALNGIIEGKTKCGRRDKRTIKIRVSDQQNFGAAYIDEDGSAPSFISYFLFFSTSLLHNA
jgi:hypothetical protein